MSAAPKKEVLVAVSVVPFSRQVARTTHATHLEGLFSGKPFAILGGRVEEMQAHIFEVYYSPGEGVRSERYLVQLARVSESGSRGVMEWEVFAVYTVDEGQPTSNGRADINMCPEEIRAYFEEYLIGDGALRMTRF